MYNNQKFKIIIFLILWGLNFASEELSIKNLMSQFNNEKKIGHFETADKIANQIIKILEIDPNIKNEQFANYLELFAEFYFQFEQDSIANELFFRSAKIYENEIIRLQNQLLNPLISMDEIFNATSDSFAQSPYYQLINEISDSNRVSNFDSLSINPYSSWFPEIRYFDNAQDSLYIVEFSNDEAIELTNIAISYFERGLFNDALELWSQAISMDDKYLTHEFLTENLFTNLDSTQLFLDAIFMEDSLSNYSSEKKFIIGLANLKLENFDLALSQIQEFQQKFPNQLRNIIFIADIYFGLENWFESLINYHWAVQKSPKNIHAKIGFSLSMMHRGDFQGARIVMEKLIQNEIKDYRVYLALGIIYFNEKKFNLADLQLSNALKIDPQNAEIHFNLGKVHFTTGRLSQALESFTKSTQYEKENGKYHFYLGQVYEKILKIDEAIANYKITRKFSPDIAEANRRLGLLLFNKNNYRKAVEPLRDYIIHNPDSTRILSIFSDVLFEEIRYPEAIDGYTRLIQNEPDNIDYYLKLAKAYTKMEDFENAMLIYEMALDYNDELASVYIDLGNVTYELGHYAKTIHYLNESMNCVEPNFETNYLLGLAYGNLDQHFQAILAFNQAEKFDSSDITISFQTGVLFMELNLFEDALIKFQKYEIEYPMDAVVQFLIGKCLYNLGEFESAIFAFERAIKINRNDSDSQFYIGLSLKQMGDLENAAVALKKATLLNPDNHLYHFEIGQIYLAIGKIRLAYNEANILQLLESTYFDSLNSLIQFNVAEKDSSAENNIQLD